MKEFPQMRQVGPGTFVPVPPEVDKDPFAGEFERVDDMSGTTLYTETIWRLIRHANGTPIAATDGNTTVPWQNIRLIRRRK